ncbi:hypothetical protein [Catellatospora sp. NPDC049133]|uniref:hypothetical protein n=1 Tax=Catellatospora sp. NPDC049133 TaxID=3155499 RepID=UPI0033E6B620
MDLVPFVGWVLSGEVIYYDDVLCRVWTAPHYARLAAATQVDRVAQRRAEQQGWADRAAWLDGAKQRIAAAEREIASGPAPGPITPARAQDIRLGR